MFNKVAGLSLKNYINCHRILNNGKTTKPKQNTSGNSYTHNLDETSIGDFEISVSVTKAVNITRQQE